MSYVLHPTKILKKKGFWK